MVSQKELLEQLQIKEAESKTSKNKSCRKPNKKGLLRTVEKENSSESEIEDESVDHLKRKMKIVMKVLKKERNMKYLALTSNSQNHVCFMCGLHCLHPFQRIT